MILGMEESYFHIIKAIDENPTVNIIFNGERQKNIFSKIRKKARCHGASGAYFHHFYSTQ